MWIEESTAKLKNDILLIIPCRLRSSRLPGKVLLPIDLTPMVVRVYQQIERIPATKCFVLCDDSKIKNTCEIHSVPSVLSNKECYSGTHRIATWLVDNAVDDNAIIVNIQADEPWIEPQAVTQVINILKNNKNAAVSTLWAPQALRDAADPNRVKIVTTVKNRAIYFSRSLIPNMSRSSSPYGDYKVHVGLYAYRAWALKGYCNKTLSQLAEHELLEQLYFIENEIPVYAEKSNVPIKAGIDTLRDYQLANQHNLTGKELHL